MSESKFQKHVPIFVPDERQEIFMGMVGKFEKKMDGMDSMDVVNVTYGWPASSVNMGWLQDKIKELSASSEIENEDDVVEFLRDSIQRLKRFEVKKEDLSQKSSSFEFAYRIDFRTKDDRGWYHYEFSVNIPKSD